MKAHLIDTYPLVPTSRSSTKVKVKYQGHVSQKMGVSGALVFHKHILLHEQLAHLHTRNTHKKVSNIASDEDIMENNNMFVILWNLSIISHLIFPQSFFFISGAKSENN